MSTKSITSWVLTGFFIVGLVFAITIFNLAWGDYLGGSKAAKQDWENEDAVIFLYDEPTQTIFCRNLTIFRWYDSSNGLPFAMSRSKRFLDGYNFMIRQLIAKNGCPSWSQSYVISDAEIAAELDSPRKENWISESTEIDNIGIEIETDSKMIFHCNNVEMGVDVNSTLKGFETWKSCNNSSIRFVRVGTWIGAFHVDGSCLVTARKD